MQETDFIAGLITGIIPALFSGLIAGYLIEHRRFKNNLRIERLKRLTPHMELAHPIVEQLKDDMLYLQKTQTRNFGNGTLLKELSTIFDKYELWYRQFQENGYKPELGATDKALSDLLHGLFIHANMVKKYGEDHIQREVVEISKSAQDCCSAIEQFLST